MSKLVLFIFCLTMTGIEAIVPEGYIVEVFPNCGTNTSDNASITVVTDLDAEVKAECGNGIFQFNNTDTVNLYLPVSFKGRNSSLCEFKKRAKSETYVVKIVISYGEPGQMVAMDGEEFTVSCTYDSRISDESGLHIIKDPLIAPPEIQNLEGTLSSNSTFTLQVNDVLGGDITGQDIDIGRWIYLSVSSDGGSGELGIRPIGCNVISNTTNKAYAIIRAGCGDGVVFKKDEGFQGSGLTSRSPYFPAFHVAGDRFFNFECNFTLCNKNCDGDSCVSERNRRDVDIQDLGSEPFSHVHLRTRVYHLRDRSDS